MYLADSYPILKSVTGLSSFQWGVIVVSLGGNGVTGYLESRLAMALDTGLFSAKRG